MKTLLLIMTMIMTVYLSAHVLSYGNNNPAYALSCEPTNMTKAVGGADVVFFGEATSKEYVPNPRDKTRQDALVQFSVIEPFKGIKESKVNVVSEEWFWGFNFTKGIEYVVFADRNDNVLRSLECSPTGTLDYIGIDEIRQVAQKHTLLPPLKQFKAGMLWSDIQCHEGLELVVKTTNGRPACVKHQSVEKLIERGWATTNQTYELVNPQTYSITKNEKTFQIQYSLEGAKLSEMISDDVTNSIHALLDDSVGGKLVISIPRDLIDAEIGGSGKDAMFIILIDEWEYLYGEKNNENERTLTILFPRGAHDIEIIGTILI